MSDHKALHATLDKNPNDFNGEPLSNKLDPKNTAARKLYFERYVCM